MKSSMMKSFILLSLLCLCNVVSLSSPTTTPISNLGRIYSISDRILTNLSGGNELNENCGKPELITAPRINNDGLVRKGDWPWLVAIFFDDIDKVKLTCEGTIISAKSVLTAAHCISFRHVVNHKNKDIFVVAGLHKIREFEDGAVLNRVTKADIHSDFDKSLMNYDADLALLTVEDRFEWVFVFTF